MWPFFLKISWLTKQGYSHDYIEEVIASDALNEQHESAEQKSSAHQEEIDKELKAAQDAAKAAGEAAKNVLDESEDIKRKWSWAVEWLNDELERNRGPYPGSGQFSYNNWSPPAQSNETGNGYFLERSHSARLTLEKACELLPEEVSYT